MYDNRPYGQQLAQADRFGAGNILPRISMSTKTVTELTASFTMDSPEYDEKRLSPVNTEPLSPSERSGGNDAQEFGKTARRKADMRLLIWYSFVYLVMRVHVSNISNTAIMNLEQGTGIQKQLGNLTSQQWAWVLSIFYYPYMLAEPLATLALKHFSPSVWMSRIMITWVSRRFCQHLKCTLASG